MRRRSRCIRPLWVLLLVLASCTQAHKGRIDTAAGSIVWPGAPEKPRVKYLWSLTHLVAEVGERKGFLDVLSGRDDEEVTDPRDAATLLRPQGIFVDERRYYIADPGAVRVTIVDRKTMDVMHITEARGASLEYPIGVAAAADGRIIVSDPDLKRVMAYSESGSFLHFFDGEFGRPTGLAVDRKQGVVYVVDTLQHCVHVYGLDGKRKRTIGRRGEGDGEFNFPSHAFVDGRGDLYVTDFLNFRIQIFSPEGLYKGKMGVLGDSYDSLDKPKGVAVDRQGHIFIVDAGKDMVKIFDRNGRLLLFFGETGHRNGDFYLPTGIFIDDQDVVYVADTVNRRLQAFQFLGGE